ncbi:MAG: bifunctional alpha,alpha-trehalose-phosphate synthase (UDP-forming)/trehalose-phosphatase [Candidatus Helarchaeota archaeon]
MPENILIVSNRLPVTVEKRKGKLQYKSSIGGVVTGLQKLPDRYKIAWLGWPGIALYRHNTEIKAIEGYLKSNYNYYPIFLGKKDFENYYAGFCNKTIWPLFHYFTQYTVYNNSFWHAYRHVNGLYCKSIVKLNSSFDFIFIHDFHLMLLPQLIRSQMPDAKIGFFLHIPFPSFELFRLLPWRKEILQGLLGADLIGFHTYNYSKHFLDSLYLLLGIESKLGQIQIKDRIIKVDTFPLGIDFPKYFKSSQNQEVQKEIHEIQKQIGNHKVIFSIDRLDYTKGIPQRLEAFDYFLKRHPEYRKEVTFICVAVPSRTIIDHYQELKRKTNELVGKINGQYGDIGWTPIWYLNKRIPFNKLVALYNVADVALITPLRDGMNLVAKEYIATKRDGKGILILSETAGAAQELSEALIVNTNNKEEIAEALNTAFRLPVHEQIKRNRSMQTRLRQYDASRWASEFINALNAVKEQQSALRAKELNSKLRAELINNYKKSTSRLLLLDYDGTLVEFFKEPADAKPSEELCNLLKLLIKDERNEIVIISGREKETLEHWFGQMNINLVAEASVWFKEKRNDWKMLIPIQNEWKTKIRPILELYRDRTPGSNIEEKEFSLTWHYQNVTSELGTQRAREIADVLRKLAVKPNVSVSERNKSLEIKNVEITKEKAATYWLQKNHWDFILAIGDNWTDEDVFSILPKFAYSIKVGSNPTLARFTLSSPQKIKSLLNELISS